MDESAVLNRVDKEWAKLVRTAAMPDGETEEIEKARFDILCLAYDGIKKRFSEE